MPPNIGAKQPVPLHTLPNGRLDASSEPPESNYYAATAMTTLPVENQQNQYQNELARTSKLIPEIQSSQNESSATASFTPPIPAAPAVDGSTPAASARASAALDPFGSSALLSNSMFGGMGGGMFGGSGYGMMPGAGMYSMPYNIPPPYMSSGPLSTLNHFLFGIQNVIFSLTQAVQIVSMNTQALQQLMEAAMQMINRTLQTWKEMMQQMDRQYELETEEERVRRRRLRAMRWMMITTVTYAAYKLVRRAFFARPQLPQFEQQMLPYRSQDPRYHRNSEPYNSHYFGGGYGAPYSGGGGYGPPY